MLKELLTALLGTSLSQLLQGGSVGQETLNVHVDVMRLVLN